MVMEEDGVIEFTAPPLPSHTSPQRWAVPPPSVHVSIDLTNLTYQPLSFTPVPPSEGRPLQAGSSPPPRRATYGGASSCGIMQSPFPFIDIALTRRKAVASSPGAEAMDRWTDQTAAIEGEEALRRSHIATEECLEHEGHLLVRGRELEKLAVGELLLNIQADEAFERRAYVDHWADGLGATLNALAASINIDGLSLAESTERQRILRLEAASRLLQLPALVAAGRRVIAYQEQLERVAALRLMQVTTPHINLFSIELFVRQYYRHLERQERLDISILRRYRGRRLLLQHDELHWRTQNELAEHRERGLLQRDHEGVAKTTAVPSRQWNAANVIIRFFAMIVARRKARNALRLFFMAAQERSLETILTRLGLATM